MKRTILATCLLAACASEPTGSNFTGTDSGTDGTSGTGTSATQTSSGTGDAGSDSVGSSASGSAGSGSSTMGPSSGSDSASSGSSTSGMGTGTATGGSSETSSTATSTSAGTTTGGTTGGVGEMRFPGDECDPFIDWCLDSGGNYECQRNFNTMGEVNFTCTELNDSWGDGGYASRCDLWAFEQCQTGFWCGGPMYFPPNTCDWAACCTQLCAYQEVCGNGKECEILIWQADLADYLDKYTGVGVCPQ